MPYYDFEREYPTEKGRSENYDTDLKFALESVKYFYNGVVYIFDASGFTKKAYKNSFHFIIRGSGYYSHAGMIPKLDGFDPIPYNNKWQLFRLPRCSKKGQNRPLNRIGELHDNETFEDYIIQNVKNEVKLTEHTIQKNEESNSETINEYIKLVKKSSDIFNHMLYSSDSVINKNITIRFSRTKTTNCSLCNKCHNDNSTPYLKIYPASNKIFWGCFNDKTKKLKFICLIDPTKVAVKPPNVRKTFVGSILCNNKYCSDIPEFMNSIKDATHKTIALKSNMGTGKTYAAAQAINTNTKNLRVGVISFRVSLAKKYEEDFKNFTSYKSKTERNITEPQWICQLDSLYRVQKKQIDRLFIDEVSQARKHLTSSTFMKNTNYMDNRASLKFMIKTAKQVIIMDANLTDADVKWIESMRSGDKLTIINSHIPTKRVINMINDEAIIRSVNENLIDNRKCVIAHNGSV